MGITIATKSSRLVLKLDDQESERLFQRIVMQIMRGGPSGEAPRPEPGQETFRKREEAVQRGEDGQTEDPVQTGGPVQTGEPVQTGDSVQTGDPMAGPTRGSYSGFLYLKCPECGETKAFCTKKDMSDSTCRVCGTKFELHGLKRMHLNCECGRASHYWTNMDEYAFDVNCVECGSPVPVEYHGGSGTYETMR